MTKEIIHVACNIDSSYVKYCIVMLTSLFENNRDKRFHIHIIASELSEEAQKILKQYIQIKYQHQLDLYLVGKKLLKDCKIYGESHISLATYYRIFLPSILPQDIDKVLYLDCDIIINNSIDKLWNTDIKDYALGCVEDMWSGKPDNYQRLKYSSNYSYFNAGVLLINLKKFRSQSFEQKAVEYINKNINNLIFNDQDVLNGLLYDKKLFLPFRWNIQDGFLRKKRRIRKESFDSLDKELRHPVIIHYTGSKKPWQYKSQNPFKDLYFHYLDMTEWKGERPNIPFSHQMKCYLDTMLLYLKLKEKKYKNLSLQHE